MITKSPPALVRATLGTQSRLTRASLTNQLSAGRPHATELAERCAMWVHRCASINATAAACVPFKLFSLRPVSPVRGRSAPITKQTRRWLASDWISPRTKSAIRGRMDDITEIESHAALELLQDINAWSSGYEWRESVYFDLQLFGRHFTHIVSNGNQPAELWRCMPQKMKVIPSVAEFVDRFEYGSGEEKAIFDPEEILWVRLFDPHDPWGGLGPLEAWLKTVDASIGIQMFQDDLFKRFGVPDYVIKTKHELQNDQKRAFRRDWKRLFGRFFNRKESVAFLSGETEIERLGQTNRELEYGESEDRKRDQIGQAFGIPKSILTTDDVNRANALEASRTHARLGYWPLIQRFEDSINEQLISRYGNLILVHENPVPEDQEAVRAERESRLRSGYTIDDVRVLDGEEPLGTPESTTPFIMDGIKTLDQLVNPPEPPPMLPMNGNGEQDEDEEEDQPAPEERMFTFEQVKALFGIMREPVQQIESLPEPPISQKEHWHKALQAENPDGDTRLDDDIVGDLDAVLRGMLQEVVQNLEAETEKAIRPTGPTDPDDYLPSPESWMSRFIAAIAPHIRRKTVEVGQEAMQAVGVGTSFDLENPRTANYLGRVERRIGREVTDTYRSVIRKELLEGMKNGESSREIANRIRAAVPADFTKAWSERIARTEMAFASVNATEQGWLQSGVVVGKQFVLAPDACPWCEAVASDYGDGRGDIKDSKTVKLGQPFYGAGSIIRTEIDGQERTMVLDYSPDDTDPSVPPVHPHCRCSVRPVLDGEA